MLWILQIGPGAKEMVWIMLVKSSQIRNINILELVFR